MPRGANLPLSEDMSMSRLALIAVSTRTATISIDAEQSHFFLPALVDWRLINDENETVATGVADQAVFTIHDLQPSTRYRLVCDKDELDINTSRESRLVNIVDEGASPELDDNAPRIQAAINTLPNDATLVIPAGTFRSGPLFLKSNMTLLLEQGAVLLGHENRKHYPILPARHADGRVLGTWEGVAEACFASLITAIDCQNLNITGSGLINGGADAADWWTWPKETRDRARRPRTLFVSHSDHVQVTGLAICNSPSWTVHPVFCRDFLAADLRISNDPHSPNTDGLNPECSRDVRLAGIHFSVGDDCIAIKAGKRDPKGGLDQPCQGILIENCHMQRGHGGVVIGSEMSGTVRDVTIRRCSLRETDRGLRIKTRRGRGGQVSNISLDDCYMDQVATPLVINAFYFCDADGKSDYVQSRSPLPVTDATPKISGIHLRNVVADNVGTAAAAFYGLPEAPVTEISIENYRVTFDPNAKPDVPDMACGFIPLRHGGIIAENAEFDRRDGIVLTPSLQSVSA